MNFELCLADMSDAEKIYELMKSIYEGLEDKSLFFCDDLDYVKEHICESGFAVKVECEGVIVASIITRFPNECEDNLGRDIGLKDCKLCKVAHLESIVVDEKYRGFGLQDKLIKYAEKLVYEKGYKYVMATVSPDNTYSLNNFKKNGFEVVCVKEKYGGLIRAVLVKGNDLQF